MDKQTKTKHTPTPWILNNNGDGDHWISTPNDEIVLQQISTENLGDNELDLANAQFIVKAVNNHHSLLNALESAIDLLNSLVEDDDYLPEEKEQFERVKQALSRSGEL